MRAWLLGGIVLCCAATVGAARAQECGQNGVERTAVELQKFAARQGGNLRASDASAGRSFDVGEIAILEDGGDGELVYGTRYGDKALDVPAIARRFYRTHPDDFDFLTVFTAFPTVDPITEAPFSAYSMVINNDIRGIHLPNVDYSADFGSAGNLEGILNMNNFADGRYLRGPHERLPGNNDSTLSLLAHETGHRWGARVQVDDDPGPRVRRSDILLGRQFSHWSFYLHAPTLMGSSALEGNWWQFFGDGAFHSVAETDGYSALDQYLMGVRAVDEVPPFFVVDGAHIVAADEAPQVGVREFGLARWFTARDVQAAEGRRFPGFRSAAGTWRQAFLLIVPKGYPETHPLEMHTLVMRLESLRREWEWYFYESTEGRATIHTGLHNTPTPLYRLYWRGRGVHFYTTSDIELIQAIVYLGFELEGTVGNLFPTQAAGTVPVYRLFHPTLAKHLYTVNPVEWETAITRDKYHTEGVVGYLYPDPVPGTVPLYRLYHYGVADHFYTNDPSELAIAVASGYIVETIMGYVPEDEATGVQPS